MTRNIVAILILILSINVVFSQNITDKNGLKQGKWSNQYESGRLQYKGEFKDGIEVGLFTFYYHSGDVKATKEFFHHGKAAATHIYYPKGTLQSSGLYVETLKDSTWNYYNEEETLILSEQYLKGSLHGKTKTYLKVGIFMKLKNGKMERKMVRGFSTILTAQFK